MHSSKPIPTISRTRSSVTRVVITATLALMLAACASRPPSESLFSNARGAIEMAERAGAAEHAPVELRFAREKLRAANTLVDTGDHQEAEWRLAEAEINAELALAKARAAKARQRSVDARHKLEQVRRDIRETFGEAALENGDE